MGRNIEGLDELVRIGTLLLEVGKECLAPLVVGLGFLHVELSSLRSKNFMLFLIELLLLLI